jgi:ABC-type cobalt transport system substrate-binding protein
VELKSPSCNVTVAVNGHTGRFGGAGTDGCDLVPQAAPANWFVPFWE